MEQARRAAQDRFAKFVSYGDTEVGIVLCQDVFWLPKDSKGKTVYSLIECHAAKHGKKPTEPTEGYLEINGRPEQITYNIKGSNIDNTSGVWTYTAAGNFLLEVSLAGKTSAFKLVVKDFPVSEGVDSSEVIKAIGLPDTKEKHWVSWPDTADIDGILYAPSAEAVYIDPEHWKYRQYPGVVISIVASHVYEIESGVTLDETIAQTDVVQKWEDKFTKSD